MQLIASGKSHLGKRVTNEDHFGFDVERGLFVVADGMGGAGAVASRLAVDTLLDHFRREDCGEAMRAFEEATLRAAALIEENPESTTMAATLAGLAIRDGGATVAHVGDSRVYRLRRRRLERLTRDHSVVSDIEMTFGLAIPSRTTHPMGTVLTRALGGGGDARPDVRFVDVSAHDRYLICSDGLTDAVEERELRPLLAHGTAEDAVDALLRRAIAAEARDNVTALVVDVRP